MKKSVLIIVLLLIASNLFSQDFEPAQRKFFWALSQDSVLLSSEMEYFKQKDFLLGWHWGGPKKISQALMINQYDASHWDSMSNSILVDSNCYVIWKPIQYTHGDEPKIMNVRAIQFDPTLPL